MKRRRKINNNPDLRIFVGVKSKIYSHERRRSSNIILI